MRQHTYFRNQNNWERRKFGLVISQPWQSFQWQISARRRREVKKIRCYDKIYYAFSYHNIYVETYLFVYLYMLHFIQNEKFFDGVETDEIAVEKRRKDSQEVGGIVWTTSKRKSESDERKIYIYVCRHRAFCI